MAYRKDNVVEDWYIEKVKNSKFSGTGLAMEIALDSERKMQEVYSEYQQEGSDGIEKFDKTHILVQLSMLGDERYVSRSQARRICLGLEKFKHVVLDFKNISTVGQGFVDEVFRVFQSKHPRIKITYTNANDDVQFMIERSLPVL